MGRHRSHPSFVSFGHLGDGLEVGVLRAERRNPQQGAMLRGWPEQDVKPNFSGRILSIGLPAAVKCASLHIPAQNPERDTLIAATALVHGMTVVTRNIRDLPYTA